MKILIPRQGRLLQNLQAGAKEEIECTGRKAISFNLLKVRGLRGAKLN
jgi:hypothetical protein